MTTTNTIVGKPIDRVDGRLKVTGGALYATEFNPTGVLQAAPVMSTIAKGKITGIDTAAAEKAPGVRLVLTHLNAPKLKEPKSDMMSGGGIRNEERNPLSDTKIGYGGQYVALVVADTFERAAYAASLVQVSYAAETPELDKDQAKSTRHKPKSNDQGEKTQLKKGDVAAALKNADFVKIEATYDTPTETHNPMEPSGTVATWEGDDRLIVSDATQYVKGAQDMLARTFGIPKENVRVICPFVGGGFGCKGATWPHTILAATAAKMLKTPVKFAIPRQAMFTGTGHRTPTTQKVALAASRDGKLQAISHTVETLISPFGEFVETAGARSTGVMYASPSIEVEEVLYEVNIAPPTFMRAPGECPGTYALECALDELSYALKMDPVALRVANHADEHPFHKKPFSAKHLKEAYTLGAEKFGWSRRNPEPRSMRDGPLLIGWGMATATYPAYKMAAEVKARLNADGSALVQCATHDLGTGAYTVFTQISAEKLGVPMEKVKFELGNSDLPFGPVAGGSNSTATVGSAICEAAADLHNKLIALAVIDPQSPLKGLNPGDVALSAPGQLASKSQPAKTDTFADILRRANKAFEVGEAKMKPPPKTAPPFEFQSWGAQFVEVKIDPLAPRVQVSRVVSVMNCGQIINAKTARSQVLGGVTMGLGMALEEETIYDPKTGLPATRNLADYHVPVNADVPSIEPYFVGEPDFNFNPLGARGLGEIGITGTAAAVANAVFHATGKRVRDLPITPDKLLV